MAFKATNQASILGFLILGFCKPNSMQRAQWSRYADFAEFSQLMDTITIPRKNILEHCQHSTRENRPRKSDELQSHHDEVTMAPSSEAQVLLRAKSRAAKNGVSYACVRLSRRGKTVDLWTGSLKDLRSERVQVKVGGTKKK